MTQDLKENKVLSTLILAAWLVFFISLICSFRAISSIGIALILLCGVIKNKLESGHFFPKQTKNLFLAGCILFFLLQLIALLYTQNPGEGWDHIRLKTGLVIIPLAVYCTGNVLAANRQKLFSWFTIILAIASLYCLVRAFLRYRETGDIFLLFYHELVSPLSQHAVYFSIFVFIALVFLLESTRKQYFIINRIFQASLIVYFSVFLFLLSSKLVLVFCGVYLLYYFISIFRNSTTNKPVSVTLFFVLVIGITGILLIPNPVDSRFKEIIKTDINWLQQEKFSPGDYINGLQFRLLQWKLVPEILSREKSWWTGVSPGDAQSKLDQQYIAKNMYTGDPASGSRGFLGYNTHNQFLEALLQNGIPGLFIFLFICFTLIRIAWQKKERMSSFVILLLLIYALSESVLETQYGLIIFTFFPLFVSQDEL